MTPAASDAYLKAAGTYFAAVDSGRMPDELFAPDFEFFFPKYGVGQGIAELQEFATGLWEAGLKVTHHRDQLKYIVCGAQVIVEGVTFGHDKAGVSWDGGKTPGGRFCSVFDFNAKGLIQRMYVYMDPDYTAADKERLRWNRANPRW
ncbi:MAG TPA: nuclear transport factor 2 family protein [Phenylobacterium sp.]|jgi:hypothetical protein|nr:nuclear transport factor 2 family protein [Phenylobacterium sp.]